MSGKCKNGYLERHARGRYKISVSVLGKRDLFSRETRQLQDLATEVQFKFNTSASSPILSHS